MLVRLLRYKYQPRQENFTAVHDAYTNTDYRPGVLYKESDIANFSAEEREKYGFVPVPGPTVWEDNSRLTLAELVTATEENRKWISHVVGGWKEIRIVINDLALIAIRLGYTEERDKSLLDSETGVYLILNRILAWAKAVEPVEAPPKEVWEKVYRPSEVPAEYRDFGEITEEPLTVKYLGAQWGLTGSTLTKATARGALSDPIKFINEDGSGQVKHVYKYEKVLLLRNRTG